MTVAAMPFTRQLDSADRYRAPSLGPEVAQVPALRFVMIDGRGDPNTATAYRDAIGALYALSYTLKFALKKELGLSYRVGPLEGIWWADDMRVFDMQTKADYRWTAMIAQPEAVTPEWFARARDEIRRRKSLASIEVTRLERYAEGLCSQILHVGPYSAEGPTIGRLHAYIKELGGTFDGRYQKHHEIYLGDPRRTAPEKWRTIIRQPFTLP